MLVTVILHLDSTERPSMSPVHEVRVEYANWRGKQASDRYKDSMAVGCV